MTKRIIVWIAIIAILALTPSCINALNTRRGRGDSPVGHVDNTPKEVIQLPDRFGNVADACDGHGHRVFVTTHVYKFGYFVVIADPTCTSVL